MIDDPSNTTFCPLLWVHQMVNTDGSVRPCCASTDILGNHNELEEAWNNDKIRDIRRKMVAGEPVDGCNRCYDVEQIGRRSMRNQAIHTWGVTDAFEKAYDESIENDMVVDAKPVYLDLRFGNLCNLVCKMCNGYNSSQISKDNRKLKALDPVKFKALIGKTDDHHFDWHTDPDVWETLKSYVPHIERIYLTGGEPTLIEENLTFLQYCIDAGYAHQIRLQFNSNLTNIPDEFLDIITQFSHTIFSCSIDGSHLVQEYIRYPSKWNVICDNMRKVWDRFETGRAYVSINIVGQLLNVLDLSTILDDLLELHQSMNDPEKHDFGIMIESLIKPKEYRIQNAPDSIKHIALTRLVAWKTDTPEAVNHLQAGWNDIDAVIHQLISPPVSVIDYKKIFNRLKFIDCNKKAKMETHVPELHDLLKKHVEDAEIGVDESK